MSTHYYQHISLDYKECNKAHNRSPTDSKGYILWQSFFQYPRNDVYWTGISLYEHKNVESQTNDKGMLMLSNRGM